MANKYDGLNLTQLFLVAPENEISDHIKSPIEQWDIQGPTQPQLEQVISEASYTGGMSNNAQQHDQSIMIANWQPIGTAPVDNSRLLYLARFNEDGRLVELDFDGVWEYWEESWELAHINGWYWASNNGIEEPTHWAYQNEPIPLARISQ